MKVSWFSQKLLPSRREFASMDNTDTMVTAVPKSSREDQYSARLLSFHSARIRMQAAATAIHSTKERKAVLADGQPHFSGDEFTYATQTNNNVGHNTIACNFATSSSMT